MVLAARMQPTVRPTLCIHRSQRKIFGTPSLHKARRACCCACSQTGVAPEAQHQPRAQQDGLGHGLPSIGMPLSDVRARQHTALTVINTGSAIRAAYSDSHHACELHAPLCGARGRSISARMPRTPCDGGLTCKAVTTPHVPSALQATSQSPQNLQKLTTAAKVRHLQKLAMHFERQICMMTY